MKLGIRSYIEFDTDPDGDNDKTQSPFLSPAFLGIVLPYISRVVSDWSKTKESPKTDVGDVLRDLERQAGRTVADEQPPG